MPHRQPHARSCFVYLSSNLLRKRDSGIYQPLALREAGADACVIELLILSTWSLESLIRRQLGDPRITRLNQRCWRRLETRKDCELCSPFLLDDGAIGKFSGKVLQRELYLKKFPASENFLIQRCNRDLWVN